MTRDFTLNRQITEQITPVLAASKHKSKVYIYVLLKDVVCFGQFSSYLMADQHTEYSTYQINTQIKKKKYILVYQSTVSGQLHFLSSHLNNQICKLQFYKASSFLFKSCIIMAFNRTLLKIQPLMFHTGYRLVFAHSAVLGKQRQSDMWNFIIAFKLFSSIFHADFRVYGNNGQRKRNFTFSMQTYVTMMFLSCFLVNSLPLSAVVKFIFPRISFNFQFWFYL